MMRITDTPLYGGVTFGFEDVFEQLTSHLAEDNLLDLRDSKETFTLVTQRKIYDDMLFSNLSFARDNSTGASLSFTADLEQIRKVSAKVVKTPGSQVKDRPDVKAQAPSTLNKGTQQATKASDAKRRNASILARLFYG